MPVVNGANQSPVFYPTMEDMKKYTVLEYAELQQMKLQNDEITSLEIRPPQEFVKLFSLNSTILSTTLKQDMLLKPVKHIFKPVKNCDGVYLCDPIEITDNSSKKHILDLLKTLKPSSDYNWREYCGRKALKKNADKKYYTDIPYSYMDTVYDRNPHLPTGWCLNKCPSFLNDLYKNKKVFGVNSCTSFFGDKDTSTVCHRDDFGLAAACFLHPGSADKIWISVHPKYGKKLLETINDIKSLSDCESIFNHKNIIYDYELLDSLEFPYWVTQQKPGSYIINLPNVLHEVFNTGPNYMEGISFISHRWNVETHRSEPLCCESFKKKYSEPIWAPLKKYFLDDEKEMSDKWTEYSSNSKVIENVMHHKEDLNESLIEVQSSQTVANTSTRNDSYDTISNDAGDLESVHSDAVNATAIEPNDGDNATDDLEPKTLFDDENAIEDEQESFETSDAPELESERPSMSTSTSNPKLESIKTPNPKTQSRATRKSTRINKVIETRQKVVAVKETNTGLDIDLSEPVPLSIEAEKKIAELQKRKSIKKRDAPSKAKYEKEKRIRRPTAERKPTAKYLKSLENALANQRSKVFDLNEKLQFHRSRLIEIAKEAYEKEEERLLGAVAWRGTKIEQLEKQRELHKGLKKVFGEKLIEKKNLQGYISFEIARDFINGNNEEDRKLFTAAMDYIDGKYANFWKEVFETKESWTSFFGIEDERIPAHYY